jgi:biotin carboxyl carrier protein
MRYYLIDQDRNEVKIDFTFTSTDERNISAFNVDNSEFYFKKLGPHTFISHDKVSWEKITIAESLNTIVDNSKMYKVYRGYKPSGISDTDEGALVSQMPGKVVKLMTKVGSIVAKGETLLILEAMKMENEIKSSGDGIVKAIHVKEGQALDAGEVMIEIE